MKEECGTCDGTTAQLVAELKRRCPALLLAYVRVDAGNRIVAAYVSRGPWELLKFLHAKNEASLEVQAQAQVKALKRRIESGSVDSDGEVTISEE